MDSIHNFDPDALRDVWLGIIAERQQILANHLGMTYTRDDDCLREILGEAPNQLLEHVAGMLRGTIDRLDEVGLHACGTSPELMHQWDE